MTNIGFEKRKEPFTVTVLNESETVSNDLYIELFGYESADKNKETIYPGISFSLHFVERGNILLTIDKKRIHLSKGSVFLLNPFKNMKYQIIKDGLTQYYWVSLSGKKVTEYLSKAGFDLNFSYIKVPSKVMQNIKKTLFKVFEYSNKHAVNDFFFMQTFFNLLNQISDSKFSNNKVILASDKDYVDRAINYINSNYTDPKLRITDISKILFIHENYLSTLFKQTMGCSFKNYLNRKRATKAVSLIREGNIYVNEVANMVGIPDASYFTKVFKKFNGITPKEEVKRFLEEQKRPLN